MMFILIIWAASSEFGSYRLCEQRRFRRACASAQSRQNLRCSLIQARGTFGQKARSLAPLNGWACAVKICHDGMLEDTNSLDAAHLLLVFLMWSCSKKLLYTFENKFRGKASLNAHKLSLKAKGKEIELKLFEDGHIITRRKKISVKNLCIII